MGAWENEVEVRLKALEAWIAGRLKVADKDVAALPSEVPEVADRVTRLEQDVGSGFGMFKDILANLEHRVFALESPAPPAPPTPTAPADPSPPPPPADAPSTGAGPPSTSP